MEGKVIAVEVMSKIIIRGTKIFVPTINNLAICLL
jgi:hypothetical protein